MIVTTTFRHKIQDDKLKSYVYNLATTLSLYTDKINRVQIIFAAYSRRKNNFLTSCHISIHLFGIKNIDINVACKYAKDAFDQAFNQLRSKLSHT